VRLNRRNRGEIKIPSTYTWPPTYTWTVIKSGGLT
jgi:hypothetical protein